MFQHPPHSTERRKLSMNTSHCTSQPSFDFDVPQFDPEDPRIPDRIRSKFEVRDIPKHHLAEGPCWIWTACLYKQNGYGAVSYKLKAQPAHRVLYLLVLGDVPTGMELDHLCRNRACCNPAHLEPVTHQVNCKRGNASLLPTHCIRGHEYTEGSYYVTKKQRVCKKCHRLNEKRYLDKKRSNSGIGTQ